MMKGTYESELLYHAYCPDHVPKPIAWGQYQDEPNTWFYISDFHDMDSDLQNIPDPKVFVKIISDVHKESVGESPYGKYGFHVRTHLANVPIINTWEDSWEDRYTRAIVDIYDFEKSRYGVDEELETIFDAVRTKVIPRLLRPLETGGRSIKPCLVHSDLWPGNYMPEKSTNKLIVFDSSAVWGHNECDLGSWRASRYKMGEWFFKEYEERMGWSEPKEDWNDRNRFYSMLLHPINLVSITLTV
jgi:protein-ribulosamine 3-kinase